ncbi:efflux protein EncT [Cryptococcus neoformans Tu259-1]|uniref:Efflux protein EncT n=1 Tax=Cryptococcus neoformans Tu259-1 TaxID=1230072 RepID=A0A854Q7Q0_CRYNE|nr:efflux protein EncT [Cryptococcus neoformans var. grubii Tu259-1]
MTRGQGQVGVTDEKEDQIPSHHGGLEIKVSQRKKWGLLALFSLSLVIDQWCLAAFYILTSPIIDSMQVPFPQQSWVITSYTVTFAATLLFWGRVSDLYSAAPVFSYGIVTLGVLNLIISFLPERYSFFILRAPSGIAGSSSVPSAYRLIVTVFEPHELNKAFTIYGMSGALANSTGNIIAGTIMLIPSGGQDEAWRWFFRILSVILLPVGVWSVFWIPRSEGENADASDKLARMDLPGCFMMLVAIVLLILALTLGASNGWSTPGFITPLIISAILFPGFFIWESRIKPSHALLPPSIWRYHNFTLWIVFALLGYTWWSVNFFAFIEYWMDYMGEKAIIVSLRVLTEGIPPMVVAIILTKWGRLMEWPRISITCGALLGIAAYIMFIFSGTHTGRDYWRYVFPAMLFGTMGMHIVFTATSVGAMCAVPANIGGVAGATLQVAYQVGAAVSFAVQAGLFTVNEGGISNFDNLRASFYFELGFVALWLIGFLVFYRASKNTEMSGDTERIVVGH